MWLELQRRAASKAKGKKCGLSKVWTEGERASKEGRGGYG